ncbi:hypothetical protein EV421DRAFT_1874831 [Armillaria borealis]|uniref:Uncharacterized protein n=1 Tax=Armillaria borealis TaxID=47425 RepID=A0AA39IEM7_9AGAR|nr:hypothetical protein EV421DRAFT_1874831 [Armillaria borealis]
MYTDVRREFWCKSYLALLVLLAISDSAPSLARSHTLPFPPNPFPLPHSDVPSVKTAVSINSRLEPHRPPIRTKWPIPMNSRQKLIDLPSCRKMAVPINFRPPSAVSINNTPTSLTATRPPSSLHPG